MAEKSRLERKRSLARQAVIEFEDRLSHAELILMRLDAIPEDLREDDHDAARAQTVAAIERYRHCIEAMRGEGGPEIPPNRAERRAAEKRK